MTVDTAAKPPVLLLHGLGGTGETLAPLAQSLEARGFEVAHPTLAERDRLRALSGGSLSDLKLDDLLDEALERATRLAASAGKPVICGHSNGALLAQVLAAEGYASHAVLLAPVPPPSVPSGIPVWLQKLFFRLTFGSGWNSAVLRFDRRRRLNPDPPAAEISRTLLPDSGRALFDVVGLSPGGRLDPEPPSETPVTVIAGKHDRIVPPAIAQRVAARYGADFLVIHGAGHWFPADAQFAEQIAELIAHAIRHRPGEASWRSK